MALDTKVFNKDYELIIFDLDGTIIDSGPDIISAAKIVIEQFNFEHRDEEFIKSYIARGLKSFIKLISGKDDEKIIESIADVFDKYYLNNCTKKSLLYPGTIEILKYLKEKNKKVKDFVY